MPCLESPEFHPVLKVSNISYILLNYILCSELNKMRVDGINMTKENV
jgi:hypothetical protein